jgi:Ca-activated chloride channel family protein
MKRSQIIVVLAAVVAVAVVGVASQGKGKSDGGSAASKASSTPANAVAVTVASSPEKAALVKQAAEAYNATHPRVHGRPVIVSVTNPASGDEVTAIARAARGQRGGDEPVVWSPASSLWARLLDHSTDQNLVPPHTRSIVRSPLVLAMWEPLARALGWPRKQIGWADVLRLAQDPRGWTAYGLPEYDHFKLVHTNPSVSTSGLEAVSAAYFAATGKTEGLTVADVKRPAVARDIAGIENSIVHYGATTDFIKAQMRKYGPGYASAAAMEETTLVDFNQHRGRQPKLVGIYPAEGTFVSDSPYIILQAPWVSSDERAAAQAFQRFTAKYVTPEVAAQDGFRPPNPAAAPVSPVDAAHGADPKQPVRELVPPAPDVLAQIQEAWLKNRKAANIELVVDRSGSMDQFHKLEHAKDGLQAFLNELSPRDRVGLTIFSDHVTGLVPLQPFAQNEKVLRSKVRQLFADGETSLYDATAEAVDQVAALHDTKRINAVVLLADGQDSGYGMTFSDLVPRLEAHTGPETEPIRVFTIGYGQDAVPLILKKIADASDGQYLPGDTSNIESVYRGISSFF